MATGAPSLRRPQLTFCAFCTRRSTWIRTLIDGSFRVKRMILVDGVVYPHP